MDEDRGLSGQFTRALAAGEEFFLAGYISMRLYLNTAQPFSLETPFLRGLVLMALGLVVLRRGLESSRMKGNDGGLLLPLGLYLASLTAAAINSAHPSVSWEWVGFFAEVVLVVVILGDGAYFTPGRRRRVLGTIAAAAVVVVIYGLHQKLWGLADLVERIGRQEVETGTTFESPWAKGRLLADQPYGPFVTANIFAGFLIAVLPLIAMMAFSAWKKGRRVGAVVMWIVTAAAVMLVVWTHSKGAMLGLAASAALLAYLQFSGARKKTAFWGLFGAAGAGAVTLAIISPAWTSMGIRAGYWLGGLKALLTYPMGFGPGAFDIVYSQFRPVWGMETRNPHNIYLDALFGGGIILLIVFGFMLYRMYKAAETVETPAPTEETEERPIVPLLHYMGLAVGVLGAGMVFSGLTWGSIPLMLYYGDKSIASKTGAAAFVMMLFGAPLVSWWVNRLLKDGEFRSYMAPAFLAGLLAFMVHGWVDFLWPTEALVITMVAAAWAVSKQGEVTATRDVEGLAAGRVAMVAVGGMVLSAAVIWGSVMPLNGALAERRISMSLEPRLLSLGTDLLILKKASKLVSDFKGKEAADLVEQHEFSDGILAGGMDGSAPEKEQLVQTLSRNDAKVIAEVTVRTQFVVREYERDLEDAERRFLKSFRDDDRALFEMSILRRRLAVAGADSTVGLVLADFLAMEALRRAPSAGAYWTQAGEIALDRGDYFEAVKRLYTARYYYPTSPVRWLLTGDAALLAGESIYAARFYQRAMELNAETIEEQASLYTVCVYPGLIRRKSMAAEKDFDAALTASVIVAAGDRNDTFEPYPFVFREAVEELARGDAKEAAESFRLLEGAYAKELQESLKLFQWAALRKSGKATEAELNELEKSIQSGKNLYVLRKLKSAFELLKKRL